MIATASQAERCHEEPAAPVERRATPHAIIATVNRPVGDTGVHAHTRQLRDGLAKANVNCTVVDPFMGTRLWLPIFAIRRLFLHRLNKTWSTRWYRYWHRRALTANLLQQLKTAAPGAIVAQCPLSAQAALDVRAKLNLRIPVAMVCHFNHSEAQEYRDQGQLASESAYQSILKFEKQILESVDQVIYVSDWARKSVEQSRDIHPRSSTVIWNGIAAASPASVTRDQLGLTSSDLLLINVGTLEPRKNQLGLLDFFQHIAGRLPNAKLILIGEGPDRPRIQQKIDALNLTGRVLLLGSRRDVPALLPLADAYVHYANLENCPITLLEAARASLPIAAIPTGGTPEILAHCAGLSININDIPASAQSLVDALNNPAVRAAMQQKSREAFHNHFTSETMTAAYLRALGLHPTEVSL